MQKRRLGNQAPFLLPNCCCLRCRASCRGCELTEGYSTDDNARALLVSILLEEAGEHVFTVHALTYRLLEFLWHAFNRATGRFRNFLIAFHLTPPLEAGAVKYAEPAVPGLRQSREAP